MRLRKKVAVVVGGGNGIGKVTAEVLASEGVKIVVADISFEDAAKVAEDLISTQQIMWLPSPG